MANPLSTFGLMMQGADTGRAVDQDYNAGVQQAAIRDQAMKVQGQNIEAGQMDLEEARRTRDTAATVRGAGQAAVQQGKTWSGSLLDMADAAAKAGDMPTALQYRQTYTALEQMGA